MKYLLTLVLVHIIGIIYAQDNYDFELHLIYNDTYNVKNLDSLKQIILTSNYHFEYKIENTIIYSVARPFYYDNYADSSFRETNIGYKRKYTCLKDSVIEFGNSVTFLYGNKKSAKKHLKRLCEKFELNTFDTSTDKSQIYYRKTIYLPYDNDQVYYKHWLLLTYMKKSKGVLLKYPYRIRISYETQ